VNITLLHTWALRELSMVHSRGERVFSNSGSESGRDYVWVPQGYVSTSGHRTEGSGVGTAAAIHVAEASASGLSMSVRSWPPAKCGHSVSNRSRWVGLRGVVSLSKKL
jgi:hypothetical protein